MDAETTGNFANPQESTDWSRYAGNTNQRKEYDVADWRIGDWSWGRAEPKR